MNLEPSRIMMKLLSLSVVRFALLLALLSVSTIHAQDAPTLRAGVAAVDITPQQFPINMPGGFSANIAEKVHDPFHARALVLDDLRGFAERSVVLNREHGQAAAAVVGDEEPASGRVGHQMARIGSMSGDGVQQRELRCSGIDGEGADASRVCNARVAPRFVHRDSGARRRLARHPRPADGIGIDGNGARGRRGMSGADVRIC